MIIRFFSISCFLFFLTCCITGLASAAEPKWSYDTKNAITGLAISNNGNSIAAGTSNNYLYFFNRSGSLLWTDVSVQKISSVSIPADGNYVAAGGVTLGIFRANGAPIPNQFQGKPIQDLQFFSDGNYLAFMDSEKIQLFSRNGGVVWSYSLKGDTASTNLNYQNHIVVPDDGRVVIFTPPWVKKIYCVITTNGDWKWVNALDGLPLSVAMSSNGNFIAVGTDKKTVTLYSADGKTQWIKNEPEPVTSIAINSDGSYIVYGGRENTLSFVKSDGSLQWKEDLYSQIDALAITKNGSYVVAGTEDKRIHVFSSSGKKAWQYTTNGRIRDISISDNGFFVTGTDDGKISMFSLDGLPAPVVVAETTVPSTAPTQDPAALQTQPAAQDPQPKPDQNIVIGGSVVVLIVIAIAGYLGYPVLRRITGARSNGKPGNFPESSSYPGSDENLPVLSGTGIHHDVFISYSSKDRLIADKIYAALESHAVRCWMAPRDIRPGKDYPEEIINAIDSSRIMVLIFSAHANKSPHVTRELSRAVGRDVDIIPFRIEDVQLSKAMEYFIGLPQWLDAFSGPIEHNIDILVRKVKALLEEK